MCQHLFPNVYQIESVLLELGELYLSRITGWSMVQTGVYGSWYSATSLSSMRISLSSFLVEYQEPYNPGWTIDQPVIRHDLRVGIQKDIHPTNCVSHFNNFKCTYENYQFIYTDGSKTENTVGYAALMGSNSLREHLPSTSSIYTAELRALF